MNTAVVVWAIFSMYDFKGPGTQLGEAFKTADECVKVAHSLNYDSVQGGGDLDHAVPLVFICMPVRQ